MSDTAPSDGDRNPHVRVVLRPLATPIAIGLGGLLIGTMMLNGLQLGWLSGADEQRTVAYVALLGAFPLQILAAIVAVFARDSLVATGLGVFSSVWVVSGMTLLTGPVGATNDALGMFLLVDAAALLLLIVSAGRGRLVFGVVILCGCVRLTLSGLYEITADAGVQTAAGIAGLVLAAACAYGIVALLMEDLPRKSLLPVGRSGRAASSLAGSFEEQLQAVENEAGVRRQL
jgi:uncharacterized protein